MFRDLGPDTRDLLGVIAFFPRGVYENNLDRLFPTISGRTNIFDTFYALSLTYRSEGFVTMLAPLRDHLSPKDPKSSQFICKTKDRHFSRFTVDSDPENSSFEETRRIRSGDVNIEHLLDIFTTIDAGGENVWSVSAHFMDHLGWHKARRVVLGPKIEGLPDDHPFKPQCLLELSELLDSVGNNVEAKMATYPHPEALERARGLPSGCSNAACSIRYESGVRSPRGCDPTGERNVETLRAVQSHIGTSTIFGIHCYLLV